MLNASPRSRCGRRRRNARGRSGRGRSYSGREGRDSNPRRTLKGPQPLSRRPHSTTLAPPRGRAPTRADARPTPTNGDIRFYRFSVHGATGARRRRAWLGGDWRGFRVAPVPRGAWNAQDKKKPNPDEPGLRPCPSGFGQPIGPLGFPPAGRQLMMNVHPVCPAVNSVPGFWMDAGLPLAPDPPSPPAGQSLSRRFVEARATTRFLRTRGARRATSRWTNGAAAQCEGMRWTMRHRRAPWPRMAPTGDRRKDT